MRLQQAAAVIMEVHVVILSLTRSVDEESDECATIEGNIFVLLCTTGEYAQRESSDRNISNCWSAFTIPRQRSTTYS